MRSLAIILAAVCISLADASSECDGNGKNCRVMDEMYGVHDSGSAWPSRTQLETRVYDWHGNTADTTICIYTFKAEDYSTAQYAVQLDMGRRYLNSIAEREREVKMRVITDLDCRVGYGKRAVRGALRPGERYGR